jgi:hypothetical protein
MAENATNPGFDATATPALNSVIALSNIINEFSYRPKRIRNLLEELGALDNIISSIVTLTANSTTNNDHPIIDPILAQCHERCEGYARELKKLTLRPGDDRITFRGWARLLYKGVDINGFTEMLAMNRSIFLMWLANVSM